MTTMEQLKLAKASCADLACASSEKKNAALRAMAAALLRHEAEILTKNEKDLERAKSKVSSVMLDRLALSHDRISAMADGILQVAALPDPVGRVLSTVERPGGLVIRKVSVPMGVIAIVYESRPNVTSDAAALAVKSGSACVLRGGSDAFTSANAITRALQEGLKEAGINENCVSMVQDTSHESVNELMRAVGLVDLLIPRGGAGLINNCVQNALVPCIQTGTGICHVYVDRAADLSMALNIVENAKTSRPSVCNAEEVLLVHRDVAEEFLPQLKKRLVDDRAAAGKQAVELRCDARAYSIIGGTKAADADFSTEFLNYILAVAVVDSVDEAIAHISTHSTGHSDAIITADEAASTRFTTLVDSAAVYVNASTRFTDGGEFGLGCEMGISTQKLHARGPMGLEELTSYKFVITGNGQIR